MKNLFILVLFAVIACSKSDSSIPSDHMSEYEQKGLMLDVVHYAAKLPPNANHEIKFNHEFDEYYSSVAADYKWIAMKPDANGGYYFLLSRPARSLTPMVEGIGGTFRIENDSLVEYDEAFRMWKMAQEDFDARGMLLFDRMTSGKDLSLYYPQFQGDKYIEVPNGTYTYDKQKRRWVDPTGPVTE